MYLLALIQPVFFTYFNYIITDSVKSNTLLPNMQPFFAYFIKQFTLRLQSVLVYNYTFV